MNEIQIVSQTDIANNIDTEKYIYIKGAKENNLKNVSLSLPRHQFIVVTGVSGSGKSSLVIDTLFAEGQRRYVESLSSYARQFLMRMDKPNVELIEGISPAIAIEQKTSTTNSRSTVGTLTEIYDYLKVLYARIGITYSPISGAVVKKDRVEDVVDFIHSFEEGKRLQVLTTIKLPDERSLAQQLELYLQNGFSRVLAKDETFRIDTLLQVPEKLKEISTEDLFLVIDRLVIRTNDEDFTNRTSDSVETAFYEGHGECTIFVEDKGYTNFNNRFECDGLIFEEPSPNFFSFNNPYGACQRCEGFGTVIGIDEDLVVPNKHLSIYEEAIAPWKGPKMRQWKDEFIDAAHRIDFPIHKPYKELNDEQLDQLWNGTEHTPSIYSFFEYLEEKSYKIQYRVMLSRYRGRTKCPDCKGTRIRRESNYVKISGYSIYQFLTTPISRLIEIMNNLSLSEQHKKIADRLLLEIKTRLQFMIDVGLGYLDLNRSSATLSGGESQRINLTKSLGSNLTDSLYILDEPSVGLHPRDTKQLITVLKKLRDLGNTVIVVEHEEEMIRSADYLVDVGPKAGVFGGEIVFQGSAQDVEKAKNSLTAKYLTGKQSVPIPKTRRTSSNKILLHGAYEHNLNNIDVQFPLNSLTVVSGVSGSGKTTLVKRILYPAIKRKLDGSGEKPGLFKELSGDLSQISSVEFIDQNPLGRSSRSNPVTYIKAYDAIRELFADQQLSKIRGFKPKHFSFNVDAGRCETCKGDGVQTIEMQFLADVELECEVCHGKRFKKEILEVKWNNRSIYDILELSVDEALEVFQDFDSIANRLQPLQDVGMGYVKLGQSSSTLSGGEAQRVKLASYLTKGNRVDPILFIFDEPTTGLHFDDVNKLLASVNSLIDHGHTVIMIEHDIDVIKNADWVIELGPGGGEYGGNLVFQGKPEGLVEVKDSATAPFLVKKLTENK